jgi:hypothetical protein
MSRVGTAERSGSATGGAVVADHPYRIEVRPHYTCGAGHHRYWSMPPRMEATSLDLQSGRSYR